MTELLDASVIEADKYASLPRKMSRVRTPSPAPYQFKRESSFHDKGEGVRKNL